MSRPKTNVFLAPLMVLPTLVCKTHEAIVMSCSCCPTALETPEFLSTVDLRPNDFIDIFVSGVTDTLLTRGALHARSGLNLTLKNLIKQHSISRLVLIVHEQCKKDSVFTSSKATTTNDRRERIKHAADQLKSWFPSGTETIDLDVFVIKQSKNMFKVSQLKAKPKANRQSMGAAA